MTAASREELLVEDGTKPLYPWTCPRCGAPPLQTCVGKNGKRTDTHVVRYKPCHQ